MNTVLKSWVERYVIQISIAMGGLIISAIVAGFVLMWDMNSNLAEMNGNLKVLQAGTADRHTGSDEIRNQLYNQSQREKLQLQIDFMKTDIDSLKNR